MASLHAQIATGKDLTTAFELSVDLFRSGQLADLPADHPTHIALNGTGIEWQEATTPLIPHFRRPQIWAPSNSAAPLALSQPLPP